MRKHGTTRGFSRASKLLEGRIRAAGETRGFAVTRLLTHWVEIVGEDFAAMARPVDVKFSRGALGATLTVLTTGAQAPMLEMSREKLRARVNAAYGYNAISKVRITQTAPQGFAEGQVAFDHRPNAAHADAARPETLARAAEAARPVADDGLRQALERLGRNVLSKADREGST